MRQLKLDWTFDLENNNQNSSQEPQRRNNAPPQQPPFMNALNPKPKEEPTEEETKQKNKLVIEKLKGILGDSQYNEFRGMSGEYLKSGISAQQYFERFTSLFKKQGIQSGEEIIAIFDDVVSILPDPKKKQELVEVKNENVELERKYPKLAQGQNPNASSQSNQLNFARVAKKSAPYSVKPNRPPQQPKQQQPKQQQPPKTEERSSNAASSMIESHQSFAPQMESKVGTLSHDVAESMKQAMHEKPLNWGQKTGNANVSSQSDFPSLPTQPKKKKNVLHQNPSKSEEATKKGMVLLKWG
eukprot:TRINITY_DN3690_c0_g1_i1.p2 TRINITY_DN3690_c0_g1~~TRINITY_DN3690_c0_g1_i1.p2  ORF type:complete len:299 (-),score=143.87 TRINITY_DN3690_c0_g1_i1:54-950(-)